MATVAGAKVVTEVRIGAGSVVRVGWWALEWEERERLQMKGDVWAREGE